MKQTRLCGYQPQYFPRIHYLNRVLMSEVFEISDYVQFVKKHAYKYSDGTSKRGRSFQAHTVIKTDQGPLFLAVPTKDEMLPINKTKIDYSKDWARDHLRGIESAYRRSPNFEKFYPEISALLSKQYESIADLSIATILWSIARLITHEPLPADAFTLKNVEELLKSNNHYRLQRIFLASQSTVNPPERGEANAWCIALCKYANANEYVYGGTSGNAYMNLDAFAKAGIKTVLQDWTCPSYRQQFPKTEFLPNLSVIDLVMNTSLEDAISVIHGDKTSTHSDPKISKMLTLGMATLFEYETIITLINTLH